MRGGELAEYSAHAVPEGGIGQVPRLSGDGYLVAGDAAGFALNALVTVRGMDFAIASGWAAAQAVLAARAAGDLSAAGLAVYERFLRESFVMRAIRPAAACPRRWRTPACSASTRGPWRACSRASSRSTTRPATLVEGLRGARRDFMKLDTSRTSGRCGRSEGMAS